MSTYQCPKGHASTEPDYCSDCGTKILRTAEIAVAAITPKLEESQTTQSAIALSASCTQLIACPECTAPHDPSSGHFCEICGYNFVTKARGEIPIVATTKDITADLPIKPTEQPSILTSVAEIIAIIDPSLQSPESPTPPNQPPITFRLDKDSNLIGRCSELRGIYPEIALDFDSAVSHRHALLNRNPDGTFVLRDIGSTNGTKLKGVELNPMVDVPIKDGDEITLGHWTRIKFRLI
jgi:hypothetical protein